MSPWLYFSMLLNLIISPVFKDHIFGVHRVRGLYTRFIVMRTEQRENQHSTLHSWVKKLNHVFLLEIVSFQQFDLNKGTDPSTVMLPYGTSGRHFRINPVSSSGFVCLKFELFGCRGG